MTVRNTSGLEKHADDHRVKDVPSHVPWEKNASLWMFLGDYVAYCGANQISIKGFLKEERLSLKEPGALCPAFNQKLLLFLLTKR